MKKILSYLVDIQLDKTSTALNPVLDLSLRNGRFYLTTTNAVYSYGDLYDNFLRAFQKIDFSRINVDSLLVLGFGMGSVPYMLEKVFHQKFECTGVEVDIKIVEWANQYLVPELRNPVRLIQADALEFVQSNQAKYDLIVVDLFLDDLVPSQFYEIAFITKVHNLLNSNGLLLFNHLVDTEKSLSKTSQFYQGNFKKIFPKASYLEVGANWIISNKQVFLP